MIKLTAFRIVEDWKDKSKKNVNFREMNLEILTSS
jgi:hypothetical protein